METPFIESYEFLDTMFEEDETFEMNVIKPSKPTSTYWKGYAAGKGKYVHGLTRIFHA